MNKVSISIILPVKNGIKYLDESLYNILNQRIEKKYELIIIDSGSKDGSLEIIKKYLKKFSDRIILEEILPNKFGHGRTRNYGASLAKGTFLVYITQDATPFSDKWLENLILPFYLDKKVMGVFGRHIPREDCFIPIKRDIEEVFEKFSKFGKVDNYEIYFQSQKIGSKYKVNNIINFMSNVNSAIRKSFWEKYPFPVVDYGEDQYMGKSIIENGYIKAYSPNGAVYHSHKYKLTDYVKRFYDEYRALARVYVNKNFKDRRNNLIMNILTGIKSLIFNIKKDFIYLKRSKKKFKIVIKEFFSICIIELSRVIGMVLGVHYKLVPSFLHKYLSYDNKLKRS